VRAEWRFNATLDASRLHMGFTLFGADGRRIGDAIDKTIELKVNNK